MGHRALVAYRQTDGTFALHYAHWGRDVAAALGPSTPFGGPVGSADSGTAAGDHDLDAGDRPAPPRTRVDPRPVDTGLSPAAVLAAVDATIESLVVVSPRFETRTYLVCSLDPLAGTEADEGEPGGGARDGSGDDLAFARPDGDPAALRAWFVERKSAASAAVAAGTLAPDEARQRLRSALAERAALHSPDDASFLRDG